MSHPELHLAPSRPRCMPDELGSALELVVDQASAHWSARTAITWHYDAPFRRITAQVEGHLDAAGLDRAASALTSIARVVDKAAALTRWRSAPTVLRAEGGGWWIELRIAADLLPVLQQTIRTRLEGFGTSVLGSSALPQGVDS